VDCREFVLQVMWVEAVMGVEVRARAMECGSAVGADCWVNCVARA
jgi:hypothetical protein